MKNAITALLTVALVSSLMFAPGVAGASSEDDQTCDPELTVTYDDFRTNEEVIEEYNETDSVAVVRQNTRATVENDEAFARVKLENPNNYCVKFVVEISNQVMTPSTLGTVRDVHSDRDATWEATHDFDSDETYTRVSTTLTGDTSTTFAPSQLRVESLAWTGKAEKNAGTLKDRVTGLFSDDEQELEKRQYEITGNTSEMVTVDLQNPDSGEPIEDWHATYQLDGESPEVPLDTGSDKPVFYRTLTDEEGNPTAIQVTFNEDATVNFVAEPTFMDDREYGYKSYLAGLRDLGQFNLPIPGMMVSDTAVGPTGAMLR